MLCGHLFSKVYNFRLHTRCFCSQISAPHVPVLLNEIITAFSPVRLETLVDCTIGAGGHSIELIKQHPEIKLLIGIDQDEQAIKIAQQRLSTYEQRNVRIQLIHDNFVNLPKILESQNVVSGEVDGFLMDLGVSSMQVDDPNRGFSLRLDGPLDMRMNQQQQFTALQIVNDWPELDLGELIRDFGEERMWRRVAGQIVEYREENGPIKTTQQLVTAIGNTYTSTLKYRKVQRRGEMARRIHPATRTFQALRIAVNQELEAVKTTLPVAIQCLRSCGRLAAISFHSLEDRLVKRSFRLASAESQTEINSDQRQIMQAIPVVEPVARMVQRRAIIPSQEEIDNNTRCRSAKLRVLEKI